MTRLLAVLAALLFTSSAIGEPIRWGGSARVRVENWRWFETPGHEDSYLFFGTLIRVAASQQRERLDWTAELAQPSLLNLPNGAVAPAPHGQLGFGGAYYAANGNDTHSASLFLKQAAIRFRWPSHSLRVGRFEFMDGTEVAPKDATLAAVKAQRVAHRLIGNFGLSHVGRSLDGLQYVHARPELNVTALMVRPSAGVFDTSGMDQVDDVSLRYVAVTHSQAVMDARLFAIGYSDSREVLKTDNRPLAARAADRRATTSSRSADTICRHSDLPMFWYGAHGRLESGARSITRLPRSISKSGTPSAAG